jgi:hypothetical protein
LKQEEFAPHVGKSFRPLKPPEWNVNDREWLSTIDIQEVMEQYDAANPSFAFLGVHARDFATRTSTNKCVSTSICDVPAFMSRLEKEGKTHFGLVFNLDKHTQSGSHWVCIYASLDPKRRMYGVYYYDSVAMPPNQEFTELMWQIKNYMHKTHPKRKRRFHRRLNRVRRQYKSTECGVYSMVLLITCMEKGDKLGYTSICDSMDTDDGVHMHRDILYSPNRSKK